MEILLAIGAGAGLAAVAGVRAYLPLLLVGLFARLGLFALPAPFDLLESWAVIGVLAVLALLESGLDKVPTVNRTLDIVQTPLRIAAGAILFTAALGSGVGLEYLPELLAGGVIAGVIGGLKVFLRPAASPQAVTAAGVSAPFLSTIEDVVALVGAVISVFVPLVALVLVGFLLFFFYRVRKRRQRKYQGLRILGD